MAMGEKVRLEPRPGDDAPAHVVNAWKAGVDALVESMFAEQDAADEAFIVAHGGDITGLHASCPDIEAVPVHADMSIVNPIAERIGAYQAAMAEARTEGVPDALAIQLAEAAAKDASLEVEAHNPEAAAWLASLSLNTEGFKPQAAQLEDHLFSAAA